MWTNEVQESSQIQMWTIEVHQKILDTNVNHWSSSKPRYKCEPMYFTRNHRYKCEPMKFRRASLNYIGSHLYLWFLVKYIGSPLYLGFGELQWFKLVSSILWWTMVHICIWELHWTTLVHICIWELRPKPRYKCEPLKFTKTF
jgi:hypothetical protein